jgi:hypothetical protein
MSKSKFSFDEEAHRKRRKLRLLKFQSILDIETEQRSKKSYEDLEEIVLLDDIMGSPLCRNAKLLRKRWDEDYFVPLAIAENSFIREYC